jgi:hypothetical protein
MEKADSAEEPAACLHAVAAYFADARAGSAKAGAAAEI